MTVVSSSMAYRSFQGGSGRLDTRLDTPPSINRRHPVSCLALWSRARALHRKTCACPPALPPDSAVLHLIHALVRRVSPLFVRSSSGKTAVGSCATGGRRQRPDDPLLQRAGVRVEREASGG